MKLLIGQLLLAGLLLACAPATAEEVSFSQPEAVPSYKMLTVKVDNNPTKMQTVLDTIRANDKVIAAGLLMPTATSTQANTLVTDTAQNGG